MANGDHIAEVLKIQERPCENVHNGMTPSPAENNDVEENIRASGTSSRIQTLISAAVRVWELKRGIRS
jgi:hypothetical protein